MNKWQGIRQISLIGETPRRRLRELRRLEAEERNARTAHGRTRAHREGRCDMACTARVTPGGAP